MGASSSRVDGGGPSVEQREEEALAASTGSLSALQQVFARLSVAAPTGNRAIPLQSLQDMFSLKFDTIHTETLSMPGSFPQLIANLGHSIVSTFFRKDDQGLCWIDFLKGYNRCCSNMAVSTSINILLMLYSDVSKKIENPVCLEFDSEDFDGKVFGNLRMSDVLMVLWICWVMDFASNVLTSLNENPLLLLPDIQHLITSAYIFCCEVHNDSCIKELDLCNLETTFSVQKLHLWIITTLPGLGKCLYHFVQARVKEYAVSKDGLKSPLSTVADDASRNGYNNSLLTRGRAWSVALTMTRNTTNEIAEACFLLEGMEREDNLLYRSSVNGKGLNRFWSNIEGYQGPLLILVSAQNVDTSSKGGQERKQWIVCTLTGQQLENKDMYYGGSGSLFAISPIFRLFPASGKERNFIYCRLRPTRKVYDPHPKPIGIAFGGTIGNERIHVDEDFAKITIRHHAVDKTYQPGPLIPDQGFLPIEAGILDVEVWGLGGKAAREHQLAHKKRESLFTEQRRKVDLKTFGNWEDSPEKQMLDMVSDPNRVRREDR